MNQSPHPEAAASGALSAPPSSLDPATPHLTDDDLDDMLIGVGSAEAMAHLAGCAACARRQAEFTGAVTGFNQATLAWSEAKSHTIPRELNAAMHSATPRLTLAAAGLCVATLAVTLLHSGLPWSSDSVTPTTVSQIRSDAPDHVASHNASDIASDDAMLEAIASEINRPVPSPEQVYQISSTTPSGRRPAAPTSEVRE